MTRITVKAVNKALSDAGIPAEVFKGEGYWYFFGDEPPMWPQSAVYVYKLSDLSIEGWVQEAQHLRQPYLDRNR